MRKLSRSGYYSTYVDEHLTFKKNFAIGKAAKKIFPGFVYKFYVFLYFLRFSFNVSNQKNFSFQQSVTESDFFEFMTVTT